MGPLKITVHVCGYKETDRHLQEQFINSMNNNMITAEIIKELTTMSKISDVTNQKVLMWVKRVKVQRVQKAILEVILKNKIKEFDMVKCTKTKGGSLSKSKSEKPRTQRKCKCYGIVHDARR